MATPTCRTCGAALHTRVQIRACVCCVACARQLRLFDTEPTDA